MVGDYSQVGDEGGVIRSHGGDALESVGLRRIRRGFLWFVGGCAVTLATYGIAKENGSGFYVVTSGAIFFGLIDILIGAVLYFIEGNRSDVLIAKQTESDLPTRPIHFLPEQKIEHLPETKSLGPREEKWQALLKYDSEIRAAADKLRAYGNRWVHELGHDYFALDDNKIYLAAIVTKLTDEAKADHRRIAARTTEIGLLYDREGCTEESLEILRQAYLHGYEIYQQESGTITVFMPDRGTSFLRSNGDIKRFAMYL